MPLSPIQVIEGSWPRPATPVAVAATLPYSIQGNTFSFSALGFSINRTSQANWAFNPGNNAVQITYKINGTEPTPVLAVQLASLPAGTDVKGGEQTDIKNNFTSKGATLTSSDTLTIDGLSGDEFFFQQTDPTSGITVTTDLIYLLSGTTLAVIQAQADSGTFNQLSSDFKTMINSIVLPGGTGSAADAQPAAGASGTANPSAQPATSAGTTGS